LVDTSDNQVVQRAKQTVVPAFSATCVKVRQVQMEIGAAGTLAKVADI